MAEIIFKATRRQSASCPGYRQIEKNGDTEHDMAQLSDDVIILYTHELKPRSRVLIDCDKKTGEFHLKFTPNEKKPWKNSSLHSNLKSLTTNT